MKHTKFDSYLKGDLAKGCQLCVKGQKMVLFVTGLCSRNCDFCPLSGLRKNQKVTYANERKIKKFKEIIEEVKNSNAKGCSLTGGDPLLKLSRTLSFAKKLKRYFGQNFHIHIYVSTKLVTEKKLKKLAEYVDEIRFHPDLEKNLSEEAEKINLAKKFWKKENIGIELPIFPDKEKEILEIAKLTNQTISFLNLNELESGEFSEEKITRKYKINPDGYTIKNSISAGKKIIKKLAKQFPKLNIHLCTARLKNWHQYRNRLKNYKISKYGKKTDEGTVIYFKTSMKNKKLVKDFVLDKKKKQLILNPIEVSKLKSKIKIYRVEEYPTYDRDEAEIEEIK